MKTVLAFLAMAAVAAAQGRYIDSGSSITVRTNENIDARSSDGRVFTGVVDREVADRNGNVVIPRGAEAEMIVRNVSNNELVLDLESISANGQRFAVSGEAERGVSGDRRDGLGTNKRTGEYVGGGALLGVIVGAIAGGGKGAAIGAAAGAAAGAGAQVLTRGRSLNIPAESLLTFRLDRPLQMGVADNGYTRDGRHYHNGYPAGYADNGSAGYGNNGGLITCGSNNRTRVHCNADTRGGVRLSRQLSAASCREGSTWGYDSQGVWVDRGCRAEFRLSGNGGGYAGNPNDRYNRTPANTANLISCSSENQQRARCDADTRGGVRMVRQLSSATCQEGSTWGYDSQGIWVDRGCRAEFELSGSGAGYRSADRYGRSNGNGGPNTITCSSDNGQRVNCGVDTRNGVRMLRQLSDARCEEGATWGYDARGVWVDRGCRAEFEVR
jgi:hypothetical protein